MSANSPALDPEAFVQCPYEENHKVRNKRLQIHLAECRKVRSRQPYWSLFSVENCCWESFTVSLPVTRMLHFLFKLIICQIIVLARATEINRVSLTYKTILPAAFGLNDVKVNVDNLHEDEMRNVFVHRTTHWWRSWRDLARSMPSISFQKLNSVFTRWYVQIVPLLIVKFFTVSDKLSDFFGEIHSEEKLRLLCCMSVSVVDMSLYLVFTTL